MALPDPARWKRLSPLLDELLDLSAPTRAERLRALHAQDTTLAAELAALVVANEQAEAAHFLNGAVLNGAALNGMAFDADAAATSWPPPTLEGQRLGAYTLVAPLGQGGTGSVWRARRDDGLFEGEVAIKLLHLSLLGQAAAQRFRREGAILARLAHPHIARLLDAGISDGGQPYLVLELVDGERIDRHCDTQQLSVEQRLSLFADVLSALAHAHSHLVIHRDIKPSNILVGKDGSVKLLDFGIAKLIEDQAQAAEATQITREGGRALTLEYAAPEQLRGEPVTTATDVYALGVLLYQLLSGRHPTAPERATAAQLMQTTLDTEPAPLSNAWRSAGGGDSAALAQIAARRASGPAQLARQLRGDLQNIVARALRKQPAQRYATVDALADDLRRYLAHEPVSARSDSLAYRSAKFLRRHRGSVAAAALTALAIVAGLVGTITQARRAEQQAHQAQLERDGALRDLAFASGARDLLTFLVSQGNGKPMTTSELLARAEQLTQQQFADDPLTRGRLQLLLGVEYGNVVESDKSEAVLNQARASALAAGDAGLLSNIDCMLATILIDRSETQRAVPVFDQAIQRLQAEPTTDATALASCLAMRAMVHYALGEPQAMLADSQAALAALGTPRPDQRVVANSIRAAIADAYSRLGQTAKAIAAYEGLMDDVAGMGRQRTTLAAVRFNNFSLVLYAAGQTRRAQEIAARAVETARAIADTNELNAIVEANHARILVDLGRFNEAKALIEHALVSNNGRNDVHAAGMIALYGAPAWCASGDLVRCARLLATARDRLQATLPPGHQTLGTLELAQAQFSLASKQPARAREQLRKAIELFDAAREKSPQRIRALALLARTEQRLGDLAAASQHADMALAEAREVSKDFASTAWMGGALLARAVVLQAQGDTSGARASLTEALAHLHGALGDDAPATRETRALLAIR